AAPSTTPRRDPPRIGPPPGAPETSRAPSQRSMVYLRDRVAKAGWPGPEAPGRSPRPAPSGSAVAGPRAPVGPTRATRATRRHTSPRESGAGPFAAGIL